MFGCLVGVWVFGASGSAISLCERVGVPRVFVVVFVSLLTRKLHPEWGGGEPWESGCRRVPGRSHGYGTEE